MIPTTQEQFEESVAMIPIAGCWIWLGGISGGYGRLWDRVKKTSVLATRIGYELYKEIIPEGMQVLHKCDVTYCVNPEHLYVGTFKDNQFDCISRDGYNPHNRAKEYCIRGHPLSGDNMRIDVRLSGRITRRCLTCQRLRRQ